LLWIVDAYVIVYSALLAAGGTISDRRGRKGVFLLGLVLFGAGSLAGSLAPSVGALLAARALQGLGPVFLVPGSLTIIRAMFDDDRRRAQAIGLWSTGSGLGMAAGPVIGGLIASHLGWRWVFGFNVPLAAVLLLLAARVVPRLPRPAVSPRPDWTGAAPRLGRSGEGGAWLAFVIAGAGVGLCLTPMTQLAVSAVDSSRAGMASAIHNSLRQFGQVLGVAVLGAIIDARADFVAGLHVAMLVSGAALLVAAAAAAVLLRATLGLGEVRLRQAPRIEAACGLDDLIQGRPPWTVTQRPENAQDLRGLLGGLGRGDGHAVRASRAKRSQVEVRYLVLLGGNGRRENQVIVRQFEPTRPPGGEDLARPQLEAGRVAGLAPGVPHGLPCLCDARERVAAHEHIRCGSAAPAAQRRQGALESFGVRLDQRHVH
jgi:hypothetical protein